jgi:hypothetical protein
VPILLPCVLFGALIWGGPWGPAPLLGQSAGAETVSAQPAGAQPLWIRQPGVQRPWVQTPGAQEPATQAPDDTPIFRRFAAPQRPTSTRLTVLEVPVTLRPQTDADAPVDENLGLGYELGVQPGNRLFGSVAFTLGRMEWRPSDPAVVSAEVKQFDVSQSLNFRAGRRVLIGVGLGLGVLDSLVVRADGSFEHNVVPYVPFRLGLGLFLGDSLLVSLRLAVTPFFAEGHAVGQSRVLLGLGWTH